MNAFEVGGSGANARALYDRAYLMAHDCTPSTTHTDAEAQPGRPLTIRASVDHSVGDLCTACYAYTLQVHTYTCKPRVYTLSLYYAR